MPRGVTSDDEGGDHDHRRSTAGRRCSRAQRVQLPRRRRGPRRVPCRSAGSSPLGTGYRAYRAGDPGRGDRRREHRGRRPGREVGRNRGPGVEDGHVQYLRAIQNFSPALERWVLDEEAGEVTYGIVNCAGQTKSEGVATLERVDGGDGAAFEATWIGKSPLENVAAESIRVEITEDTLKNFADVATSRTDI